MEKYYIMVDGQQDGPFTGQEIINKGFSKDSYVYNKNLGSWKMISDVPEFKLLSGEKQVVETPDYNISKSQNTNPKELDIISKSQASNQGKPNDFENISKKEEQTEKTKIDIKEESKTIFSYADDNLDTVVSKILSGEDQEKQIGIYAMFRITKPNYTNEVNILLQLKNPVLWKAIRKRFYPTAFEKLFKSKSSKTNKKSQENKSDGSIKNFNRKQPLYQPIRWTLVTLFWIDLIVEMINKEALKVIGEVSKNSPINPLPALITFWIARSLIRLKFIKNPSFENKILITIGIFIGVYLVKIIIARIFLGSIL